jgi:putrescine importer
MGPDGVISRRIFAHVDARYSTPARSVYLMGGVSLAGSLLMRFQLAVELLNFGAFVGFILVNLSVIRHFYLRLRQRIGMALLTNLIFPLAGARVCFYIWLNLSPKARLAGFGWLALGLIYLAIITRGFRIPPRSLSSLKEAN